MSSRYLAVLVPQRRIWAFGQDGAPKKVTILLPDHTTQSPRLYHTLSKGGGVVFEPSVASTLVAAGYVVTTFVPTPRERAYLTAVDKRFGSGELWLATCNGIAVKFADGRVRCVPFPGLEQVPADVARSAVTSADYAPAKRWVPASNIAGWRYFGSKAKATPELVKSALETVALWDEIARKVEAVEKGWTLAGKKMPGSVHARWSRAVAWLAETAQPVSVIKKAYPQPERLAGVTPFGAVQVPPMVIIVGVVVLVVVAGLVYMQRQHTEATKINAEMQDAYNDTVKPLVACVTDKSRSREDRARCQKALDNIKTPEPQKTPLESLAEIAPYAAGLTTLVLGAFYLGPVIREASATGAAEIQRFRQGRQRRLEG